MEPRVFDGVDKLAERLVLNQSASKEMKKKGRGDIRLWKA